MLVGLFPNGRIAKRSDVECRKNPANTLQGKPLRRRLVGSGKKDVKKYQELAPEFALNWDTVTRRCAEALRFEHEFLYALAQFKAIRGSLS